MLEYWYREERTLTDFRRKPLGPHFDGFAAHLKAQGYSPGGAVQVLSKCCQFNAFLIDQGITRCAQLSEVTVQRARVQVGEFLVRLPIPPHRHPDNQRRYSYTKVRAKRKPPIRGRRGRTRRVAPNSVPSQR